MKGVSPSAWWGFGAVGAMVVGSFGPWIKALGASVSGTDGSGDGWTVVILAVLGLLAMIAYSKVPNRGSGLAALLMGGIAAVVTISDYYNVQDRIAGTSGLANVGWGLDLAIAGSVVLAVVGLIQLLGKPAAASRTLYRECPQCKEQMRRDAAMCPHCRSKTAAWVLHEGVWWDGNQWLEESSGHWFEFEPPAPAS